MTANPHQLYTLTHVCALVDRAPATIRKLESDGLIVPQRDSRNTRLFTLEDIARIKQILKTREERIGRRRLRPVLVVSTVT
jgi:DNA-binding transcriptional MerR regulator